MTRRSLPRPQGLGRVEQAVLEHVWAAGTASAEACREALAATFPMKESTVRTVLRRLEGKGYLHHTVIGRTYIYQAAQPPAAVAVRAVKQLIDRFCGGSAETLVAGLVAHDVLTTKQLERLTDKIAQQKRKGVRP